MIRLSSSKDQRTKSFFNLFQYMSGQGVEIRRTSYSPIDAFHMIDEDYPFNLVSIRNLNLKGISFRLKGNGNKDGKTHNPVIIISREDQSGSVSSLLMA